MPGSTLPLVVFLGLAAAVPVWAANLLPNGGFEEGFSATGEAKGWADNSRGWANLDVAYAEERSKPRSGACCQRLECTRLTYGAVQLIPTTGIALQRGRIYRVRGWLRGDVGLVYLQLRLAPAPYTIYCQKALDAQSEWRELSYLWTASTTDPQCRFMLRFTSTGTLWVDDLSVEEVTPEQAQALQPPPRLGNLLRNGSFDLDRANWLMGIGCDAWREADLTVVEEAGNPCLRIAVPEGATASLNSDIVPVSDGHTVHFRCRLRAEGKASVRMLLSGWSQQVEVGPEWQTVATDSLGAFRPDPSSFVTLQVNGPAVVFLDDVVMRHDDATGDSASHAAIITTRHPLGLFHDGETPALRLLASVPSGQRPVLLQWQVEDFWGVVRAQGSAAAPPGRFERQLALAGLPRGWYRARVIWEAGDRRQTNECLFCLLPPLERPATAPASSPFGGHFAVTRTNLALARAVGCRRLRLHPPNHTKWRVVEPTPGRWAWRDEAIQAALAAGLDLVGSLDRLPDWASSAPTDFPAGDFYNGRGAWLPRDWTEWERYVGETVRRYRSSIHTWEIWNEGNLSSWLYGHPGQSQAAAYLELVRHTAPIVRREDPTARVIGGVVAGALTRGSNALAFAQELVAGGGLELMDVFSFHDYLSQSVDEGGDPIQDWLPRLRQLMRDHGREMPIINSEGGFSNPGGSISYRPGANDGIRPQTMARWLVRQYVTQLALGVNEFFFYNLFIDGSPVKQEWQGFVDGDGQPSPNVAAYATLSWLLDGATFERTEAPAPGVWLHVFRAPHGRLAAAWARTGTTAAVKVAASEGWDLMGAPLVLAADRSLVVTDAPVYLRLSR
jgi:hypothetical protein